MMTTITRSRRRWFAVAAVAAVLGLFATAPRGAGAHSEYARSAPAMDAVVRAPSRVDIWFTQELFRREGANTITVEGPNGRVDARTAVLDDEDRTHLSTDLVGDIVAGEYRVSWTSLSAVDGDSAAGDFVFNVDPTAPEATAEAETATAGDAATGGSSPIVGDRSGFPLWIFVTVATVGSSAMILAWAWRFARATARGD